MNLNDKVNDIQMTNMCKNNPFTRNFRNAGYQRQNQNQNKNRHRYNDRNHHKYNQRQNSHPTPDTRYDDLNIDFRNDETEEMCDLEKDMDDYLNQSEKLMLLRT